MAKNKHLTDDERLTIEISLREGKSIAAIAKILEKDKTNISREIKKHAIPSNKSAIYRIPNRCLNKSACQKYMICYDKPDCAKARCRTCNKCNDVCPDFIEEICSRLQNPPYVCNGCKDEHICILQKKYYLHKNAQKEYKKI